MYAYESCMIHECNVCIRIMNDSWMWFMHTIRWYESCMIHECNACIQIVHDSWMWRMHMNNAWFMIVMHAYESCMILKWDACIYCIWIMHDSWMWCMHTNRAWMWCMHMNHAWFMKCDACIRIVQECDACIWIMHDSWMWCMHTNRAWMWCMHMNHACFMNVMHAYESCMNVMHAYESCMIYECDACIRIVHDSWVWCFHTMPACICCISMHDTSTWCMHVILNHPSEACVNARHRKHACVIQVMHQASISGMHAYLLRRTPDLLPCVSLWSTHMKHPPTGIASVMYPVVSMHHSVHRACIPVRHASLVWTVKALCIHVLPVCLKFKCCDNRCLVWFRTEVVWRHKWRHRYLILCNRVIHAVLLRVFMNWIVSSTWSL